MSGKQTSATSQVGIHPGTSPDAPLVALEGAAKTYKGAGEKVKALLPTDLQLRAGEFVVVTGRSGSGKTTLLNLAAGLARPSEGVVQHGGVDVWSLPDRQRTRLRSQRIGFIFQFPSLVPNLSVEENILLPANFRHEGTGQAQKKRAAELLEMVGLSDKRRARPGQLSAGQQQRAVIARALLGEPTLLIADEPTSNLDERTEEEIIGLIKAINSDFGLTVLMVTHSTALAGQGSRRLLVEGGTVNDQGDAP